MLYSVSHDCRSREILLAAFLSARSRAFALPRSQRSTLISACRFASCIRIAESKSVRVRYHFEWKNRSSFFFAGPVFPFFRLLHQLEQCLPIGFTKKLHRPGLKGFDFLVSVIVRLFLPVGRASFFQCLLIHGASSDIGRFEPKSLIGF